MAKKKPAIPLKDIMGALDKKDRGFYNRLTDEQKKAFNAWMMLRYCSSVQGSSASDYIYLTNEIVNMHFSDVSKHPELQWLLMSVCGSGKVQFHQYIKPPNARKKKNKVFDFVYSVYPHMKSEDIQQLIELNTVDNLKQLAESHGYDKKAIKDIFGK